MGLGRRSVAFHRPSLEGMWDFNAPFRSSGFGCPAESKPLCGNLYRRYLVEIMDRIDGERLPDDCLALSSAVLADILTEAVAGTLPIWCQKVTWLEYAEKRYDRVKARLIGILRESAYAKSEGEVPNGWTVDGNRIIVWEPRDAFGRRGFDWEDVPPL